MPFVSASPRSISSLCLTIAGLVRVTSQSSPRILRAGLLKTLLQFWMILGFSAPMRLACLWEAVSANGWRAYTLIALAVWCLGAQLRATRMECADHQRQKRCGALAIHSRSFLCWSHLVGWLHTPTSPSAWQLC